MRWKACLGLMMICFMTNSALAQRLTVDMLLQGVQEEPERFDSLLRSHHFQMDPVAQDTTGTIIRYYNQVAKTDQGITWIRSVSITEIRVGETISRLLNYRIYDEEEYRSMLMWLLEHRFKTRDHFDFRGSKHVIYTNGTQEVTVKEGKRLLPNKRTVAVYEFEVGK